MDDPTRTQRSRHCVLDLALDPSPDPGAIKPRLVPRNVKGERRFPPHPLLCSTGDATVRCWPWALPFADGCIDQVRCRNAIEFVMDDRALIAEIVRILQPGGKLVLTVPAAGPLAGFDAMNLYKYLVDITGRGMRLVEPREIGWRRHYTTADLAQLLDPDFTVITRRRHRLIGAELVHLAALLWHRWLGIDRRGYIRARHRVDRIAIHEDGIGTMIGFMTTLVLERRAD